MQTRITSTIKIVAVADSYLLPVDIASIEWKAQHCYGYNFEFLKTSDGEEGLQMILEYKPTIILIERIHFFEAAQKFLLKLKNS